MCIWFLHMYSKPFIRINDKGYPGLKTVGKLLFLNWLNKFLLRGNCGWMDRFGGFIPAFSRAFTRINSSGSLEELRICFQNL